MEQRRQAELRTAEECGMLRRALDQSMAQVGHMVGIAGVHAGICERGSRGRGVLGNAAEL